jgi:hypothetical protein
VQSTAIAAGQNLADARHPRAPGAAGAPVGKASNPHNAIKFSGAGPAFQLIFARGMAGRQNTPAEGGRHFMLHPFSLLFEWPVKSSHGDDLVIIATC